MPLDRTLLSHLLREGATDLALVGGRLPSVRISGKFEAIDAVAPTSDELLTFLFAVGGSRYLEDLGPRPVSWRNRSEGVGSLLFSALSNNDVVQAKVVLEQRDPKGVAPSAFKGDGKEAKEAPKPPAKPQGVVISEGPGVRTEMPTTQLKKANVAAAKPAAAPVDLPKVDLPPVDLPPLQLADDPRRQDLIATQPSRKAENFFPTDDNPPPSSDGEPSSATNPFGHSMAMAPVQTFVAQFAANLAAETAEKAKSLPPPPPAASPSLAPPPPGNSLAGRAPDAAKENPGTRPSVRAVPIAAVVAGVAPQAAPAPFVSAPAPFVPAPAPPMPEVFGAMLTGLRRRKASDLHVVAGRPALFRVAGQLMPEGPVLEGKLVAQIVQAIVPMPRKQALEELGATDFAYESPGHGRFRVNASRQRTGYKLCMRAIPTEVPTLTSLGLPQGLAAAIGHHQGLVLVTGPSGHGKTTTLAALLDLVNARSPQHVITVEDPVEFVHPRKQAVLSQREVGSHTKTFQSALKGSLREDPDVIVVGELRDVETVKMALSASETGHLVLATMNAPSAAKTIDRLIDMFPPADQAQARVTLAAALRMVACQRLVPSADGHGLHVACEMLPGSIALFSLIRDGRTFQIPSLMQRGKALGIVRLDESLAELVFRGKVSLEEAKAFAESATDLENFLNVLRKG
jgi:twitching motility protein PilT